MKMLVGRIFVLTLRILFSVMIPVCAAHGQDLASDYGDDLNRSSSDTLRAQELHQPVANQGIEVRPRIQDMVTNVPGDWATAATVAVRSSSLPYIAGAGALTGLLIATDKQTNGLTKRITAESEAVRSTSSAIVRLGDGRTDLGIAAGFALYGLAWDDPQSIRTASGTVEALLSCGIAVQVMKRIAGRESPQVATSGHGVWRWFPNLRTYQRHQSKYYAFPSGHISTTMATLTVIAENYPDVTWIRPVGYSLMACLGVSLVNVGYHWYSDFPLAIAMGYTFGMIASRRHDNLFASLANDSYSGLRVLPSVTRNGEGVTVALLF
jgi:hypothetical protein